MNEKLEWFPCEPTPLLATLAGMPAPKQLVYVVMLLRIYESGGVCRDTIAAIAMRTRQNKRVVSEALNELFQEGRLLRDGDGIANPKATVVIADSLALLKKRKSAGAEGGKRAAEKRKENQPREASTPNDLLQQSHRHLHLQEQDSLFPEGNRAPEDVGKISMKDPPLDPEADYYRRGREVLGVSAGGMLTQLIRAKGGNLSLARAAIEQAATRGDAKQYVGAMVRGFKGGDNATDRANGRGGFARIAATVRRARNERADGAAAFFGDAGDPVAGGRHRSSGPGVGVERNRQTAASPPIIDG